jgi:hypothetical protein
MCQGKDYKRSWARKNEDYLADFCLVSQQALSEQEYRVFRFHLLLGADWKLCCRKLQIDRGTFFHAVYRIEQKLGRVFRELEPHSLFPLDEYFTSTARTPGGSLAIFPVRPPEHKILRPPLQKSA